ncbi:alpha/beta hydrolase [Archangium sp.]|uniref:alpha/beta fold hydrolase n=1 Tax=Archangium sp. TaxID=1872627 RepID=UPI00286ACD79|nr:alpha/beta hydrolase [Archangium sp.]
MRQPTLIIHAGEDLAVPNQVSDYMARRIPLAKLATIEARGHLPHLSAPAEVNRVIDSYLSAAA